MEGKSWCGIPFSEDKSESSRQHIIEYCMRLKADNGKYLQEGNFWCGYFETLYGAEIVSEDKSMKFSV